MENADENENWYNDPSNTTDEDVSFRGTGEEGRPRLYSPVTNWKQKFNGKGE